MKILLLSLILVGCANPPSPKTVELDLCKARSAVKILEAADSSLAPKPSSVRAEVEKAEDALCAMVGP